MKIKKTTILRPAAPGLLAFARHSKRMRKVSAGIGDVSMAKTTKKDLAGQVVDRSPDS